MHDQLVSHPTHPTHPTQPRSKWEAFAFTTLSYIGDHVCRLKTIIRGVTRKKLKSRNMFKHQRIFVVSTTTSNITRHLKNSAVPFYILLFHDFPDYITWSRQGGEKGTGLRPPPQPPTHPTQMHYVSCLTQWDLAQVQ